MKQKQQSHLRGQRGQAFANRIRGIRLEQILCVSIDISKDFHVVLLHNGLGEIITPSFEMDIFRTGFEQLCQTIDTAVSHTAAQVILIGMEPTGHYYENLARHLQASGRHVTMINSYAVKENRRQHMMAREKNDEIDAAAIGDLLRRGEGTPYRFLGMSTLAAVGTCLSRPAKNCRHVSPRDESRLSRTWIPHGASRSEAVYCLCSTFPVGRPGGRGQSSPAVDL
ncbi:MAG: IS110 family transposase [Chloroflexi bacterium]|nr:IS110 family transposase [Chloroflexota bacterium]